MDFSFYFNEEMINGKVAAGSSVLISGWFSNEEHAVKEHFDSVEAPPHVRNWIKMESQNVFSPRKEKEFPKYQNYKKLKDWYLQRNKKWNLEESRTGNTL